MEKVEVKYRDFVIGHKDENGDIVFINDDVKKQTYKYFHHIQKLSILDRNKQIEEVEYEDIK